ncbi:MAG: hypothetical protein ACLP50_13480 [Solirubrobacteraceae bacterium]
MIRRIAARLLTGPPGFLIGGAIEIATYGLHVLSARARHARSAPALRSPGRRRRRGS